VTIGRNALGIEAGCRHETIDFGKTEAKYFSRKDWTTDSPLNRLAKFAFARTRLRA
jgi:hypothetical protein